VPRITTKAVARTTYQSRTAYRSVPYQVTRRVAEYATQTVPYQTVRYVPTTGSALAYTTTPGFSTAVLPPVYAGTTIAATPIYPTPIASATGSSAAGLVPPARYADTPSTPITPRSASNVDRFSDSRSSLFVPAPSAAQVWQTPRSSLIR
jgi:hypothetical protein